MIRGKLIMATAVIALSASACGSTSTPATTVTVTSTTAAPAYTAAAPPLTPLPVQTSTAAAPAGITIPDVTGQNAEIARTQLEGLGLTNVELASTNPKYSMVIMARNWTVVGIEPAPGTTVAAGSPVIVKVYKD